MAREKDLLFGGCWINLGEGNIGALVMVTAFSFCTRCEVYAIKR
jgi:hypothetical protein